MTAILMALERFAGRGAAAWLPSGRREDQLLELLAIHNVVQSPALHLGHQLVVFVHGEALVQEVLAFVEAAEVPLAIAEAGRDAVLPQRQVGLGIALEIAFGAVEDAE